MEKKLFESRNDLDRNLAAEIVELLRFEAKKKGFANILFSGGSTPKNLWIELSKYSIEWDKVKVGLVDDRMVPEESEDSNALMLQRNFLSAVSGSKPEFYPLVNNYEDESENMDQALRSVDEMGEPDIVLLGMGGDGHFASLFPNDPTSTEALALSWDKPLVYSKAPGNPKNRISHSWSYLRRAKNLYLHITGQQKRDIITGHKDRKEELPIDSVLGDTAINPILYWAP